MYVYKRQVTMQRGIATLLAIALVLWALGTHMFTVAEAANLTYMKDTLSDSAPGSPSDHEIQFLSPTGVGSNATITVAFPNGFNISTSSVAVADVDFEIAGVDQTLTASAPAAGEWQMTILNQNLRLYSGSAESLPSNATGTIKIGTNADGPGVNQVTNHTATSSYEFTVTAGASDSGQFRIAIIENVLVTANVDTTLTFTVTGTTTGLTINGAGVPTTHVSTNTTLPFGTLSAGVSKVLAQDLKVGTNARNGYVVTVEQDANLLSSTGADIDGFIDGLYTDSPATWTGPTPDIDEENTWGHWGLTTTDVDLLNAGEDFLSNEWVSASTTPRAVMAHDGPSDGVTPNKGYATVAYQIQITALQEAGDDYNTTLTYIATPTF